MDKMYPVVTLKIHWVLIYSFIFILTGAVVGPATGADENNARKPTEGYAATNRATTTDAATAAATTADANAANDDEQYKGMCLFRGSCYLLLQFAD